jgi:hypothetical protein
VFSGASALAAALALPEVRADYNYHNSLFQSSGSSNFLSLDPVPGFDIKQKLEFLRFFLTVALFSILEICVHFFIYSTFSKVVAIYKKFRKFLFQLFALLTPYGIRFEESQIKTDPYSSSEIGNADEFPDTDPDPALQANPDRVPDPGFKKIQLKKNLFF